MGRKRKRSRGGDEVRPVAKLKRTTVAMVATPARKEDIPLNSDMDEPQVDHIIKVELEPESDPEEHNNQQELFDDPGNPDLAPDPDIDISDVNLIPTHKVELMDEDGDDGAVASNMTNEPETLSLDPVIRGSVDVASSTSRPHKLAQVLAGPSILSMAIKEKDGEISRLTEELAEARSKTEIVNRALRMKTLDMERETCQRRLLVEQLQGELERKTDLLKHATLSGDRKDAVIKEKENELAQFQAKARYFRDQEDNSYLHLAAKNGDEPAVKKFVQLGADVNARNRKAETPLLMASASKVNGDIVLKIINFLIDHGANAHATSDPRETFLHKLASRESPLTPVQFQDMAIYLVSKKLTSLFNIGNRYDSKTPLMLAAVNGSLGPATLPLLHANGVYLTLEDFQGKSLGSYAANGNNSEKILSSLLNLGAVKLEGAIAKQDEKLVKILVELGADVNEKLHRLQTPLHLAAKSNNKSFAINIIKLLINSGADADAKDKDYRTFLHMFVYRMNSTQLHDMAAFLISKDLSRLFNTGDQCSETPLQRALFFIEIEREALNMLKNNGVDFNAANRNGESVLYYATRGRRTLKLISDLVELGANPKHLTNTKDSMLHETAGHCTEELELVKFFLGQGLEVNTPDRKGNTPLHNVLDTMYLSWRKNVIKTVQCLMENGAKSDIVNSEGETPRSYFEKHRDKYHEADQISDCFSLGSSC